MDRLCYYLMLLKINVFFFMRRSHIVVIYLPPKSIQLFSRERRQLTVWWTRPYRLPMTYQVLLLKDHGQSTGKCNKVIYFI